MKTLLGASLVALALTATAPVVTATPANAAVDFSIQLGNAAFGFSDGYWDRDHRWHGWRSRSEREYFRNHYRGHYSSYRHDHDRKDRNHGWRNDRWWDHH